MIDFGKPVFAATLTFVLATSALAQNRYPMIFDSDHKLKEIGITLGWENVKFPTGCYSYGDGGWEISISDALLAHYKSQGFSRRSACMALVSQTRFNPETGKRLATYILIDRTVFDNGNIDGISDELPVSLPRCFDRGLPYTDCVWRYDPKSGKKISAAQTQKYKVIGERIERFLSDSRTRNQFSYLDSPRAKSMILLRHQLRPHFERGDPYVVFGFYDYSNEFPKGYGYAIDAHGEAGPNISPEVVKAAIDGLKAPPQIDPNKLKEIWSSGTK